MSIENHAKYNNIQYNNIRCNTNEVSSFTQRMHYYNTIGSIFLTRETAARPSDGSVLYCFALEDNFSISDIY